MEANFNAVITLCVCHRENFVHKHENTPMIVIALYEKLGSKCLPLLIQKIIGFYPRESFALVGNVLKRKSILFHATRPIGKNYTKIMD